MKGTDCSTLAELVQKRAIEFPDRRTFTFLTDGEMEEISLTYGELDREARRIAAALQDHQMRGERALLVYSPGLDFVSAFLGCLYAGIIAVPTPAPGKPVHRTLLRLAAIAQDAKPAMMLTTRSLLPMLEEFPRLGPELGALRVITTDAISGDLADHWKPLSQSADALAFLQYTSGSTTTPRGVMVSHGNILQNAAYYRSGWDHHEDTISVTWMPTFHDLGLMDGVIQPIVARFWSILMSPVAFLQRPMRWLEAISRHRATFSSGPNFSFELCIRKSTPEERSTLDLSAWTAVLNAAEPVRMQTMERFTQAFAPSGFRWSTFCPGYGLAEATLKVSATPRAAQVTLCRIQADALERGEILEAHSDVQNGNTRVIVGCGPASSVDFNTEAAIVDPERSIRCPPNQVGEIWVSGPGVAQGYWNRPAETIRTFKAHLADTGEGPFLRTGDLGFVKDGQLFVTGRLKDLIILYGRNHYPQDIEMTVERSHPSIRPGCCAAFSVDVDSEERLVVVAEVDTREPLDAGAAIKIIRRAIVEHHDVSVHAVLLLKPGTIHKTSSGKIQRRACRSSYLDGTLDVVHRA